MKKEHKVYITVSDFLKIARVKEKTFRRRICDIKGVMIQGDTILIEEGTRYPLPKIYKANTRWQKYYLILKSISLSRYIDHFFLGIHKKEFEQMIEQMVAAKLIYNNRMSNKYGANQYSLTMEGEDALLKKKKESVEWVASLIGKAMHNIIPAMIRKFYQTVG